MLTIRKRPYSRVVFQDLETLSLIVTMITVYCGLYFISDNNITTENEISDSYKLGVSLHANTKLFFFILIVVANLFFFIYWLLKILQEFRHKFRAKFETLYLFMCLCSDKQKLEKEKAR